MRFVLALGVCAVATLGCGPKLAGETTTIEPTDGTRTGTGAAAAGPAADPAIVARELPGELVAELRLQGADKDGRLLTLAPGFVATAECSDCGAPSYLRFLAVRCVDARHCEVLTEQCEGSIARDEDLYELEFHAVEDVGGEDVCAGYSGTFELAT